MEQTSTRQRQGRRTKAIVAVLLALVLLLSGTYAWTAISQRAQNEIYDTINDGGRLHDDYDGNNKDVYVENFGQAPIFVRVRLDEYMEVDGTSVTAGAVRSDVTT
jgi:hypothetical protein